MGKNKKVEKPDDENYSVIVEEGEETLGQIPTKDPKKEEKTLDRAPVEEPDRILVKTRINASDRAPLTRWHGDGPETFLEETKIFIPAGMHTTTSLGWQWLLWSLMARAYGMRK